MKILGAKINERLRIPPWRGAPGMRGKRPAIRLLFEVAMLHALGNMADRDNDGPSGAAGSNYSQESENLEANVQFIATAKQKVQGE